MRVLNISGVLNLCAFNRFFGAFAPLREINFAAFHEPDVALPVFFKLTLSADSRIS